MTDSISLFIFTNWGQNQMDLFRFHRNFRSDFCSWGCLCYYTDSLFAVHLRCITQNTPVRLFADVGIAISISSLDWQSGHRLWWSVKHRHGYTRRQLRRQHHHHKVQSHAHQEYWLWERYCYSYSRSHLRQWELRLGQSGILHTRYGTGEYFCLGVGMSCG